MTLDRYKQKRNFDETPEPKESNARAKSKLIFVIQRHAATTLHYDFRLEMEGVLKSWAVPKGPSLNPADKRLAMQVEDHPYDYRTFEGSIPKGNYGAGEVEIWDEGTYEPLHKSNDASDEEVLLNELSKGSLKITLQGKKLQGEFALFRLRGAKQENAWLLVKHKDKHAVDNAYDAEEHTDKDSMVTKLAQKRYKNYHTPTVAKESEHTTKETKVEEPNMVVSPMLATVAKGPFDSDEWLYEIKWDGYRAIADCREETFFYSRNGNSFAKRYPSIFNALNEQEHQMILDGEIVALKDGEPSFQTLQHIEENRKAPLIYQVFDLLHLNGYSTRNLPLVERKELLKKALKESEHIQYCEHIENRGIEFFEAIRQLDLEGVMAKKKDSLYVDGVRSNHWLKIKNVKMDEAIIAGFTAPRGARPFFGSLILGQYKEGVLIYAGHVGSGFDEKLMQEVYNLLKPTITDKVPFAQVPATNMPPTWVAPSMVCTIKYSQQTEGGLFRHPVFVGIRDDLDASFLYNESIKKNIPSNNINRDVMKEDEKKEQVKFTNLDKLYWKKEKITKGDLIDYYMSVSDYILPHLKERAQSLHRFPDGVDGLNFYHKDAGKDAPSWVDTVQIFSESNRKDIEYIVCNHKDTLGYLINLGCIELNPWSNRIHKVDNPDYIVIDLDPSPSNTFAEVVNVALKTKEILDVAKIEAFCKTSGSTGIHIFIPTAAQYRYEQVRDFAHLIVQMVNQQLNKTTTLERVVNKREGKIYLDYLQNKVGQTIASVYSVRPKPHATVSMPLDWSELNEDISIKDFTIHNALKRIEQKGDIFAPVLTNKMDMSRAIKLLEENK